MEVRCRSLVDVDFYMKPKVFLLTWNCRHIANAVMRKSLAVICEAAGYEIPVICTPLELIEEHQSD